MKKIIIFMIVIMVVLSGCGKTTTDSDSGESPDSTSNNSNQQQEEVQNNNFSLFKDAPDDAIALVVNQPTTEQLTQIKMQETLNLQDTEEKIIFIPRYEHTAVELYKVEDINEAGEMTTSKFYSDNDCGKDFALELQAIRPEGMPNYKLQIKLPDGTEKEYYISYNGKDGNPNLEYILK